MNIGLAEANTWATSVAVYTQELDRAKSRAYQQSRVEILHFHAAAVGCCVAVSEKYPCVLFRPGLDAPLLLRCDGAERPAS